MARVVCQVLTRADRWTFLWSEGEASFPPYSLEATQDAELRRLARQAQQQLAALGAAVDEPGKAGLALAQTGHELYRLVLQADEVRLWLQQRTQAGTIDRLDIVGDAFSIPWTVLYDETPDAMAFERSGPEGACWKAFWGQKYAVVGGRRVQGLRGRSLPARPTVVLAIDPDLRGALPHEEQKRLADLLDKYGPIVVDSRQALANVFGTQEVHLLYVFGRAQAGSILLGPDRLTPTDLEQILFLETEAVESRGETLLMIQPAFAAGAEAHGNFLAGFERFSHVGLVGSWQPLAAAEANRCGLLLLEQFAYEHQSLAQALKTVRDSHPVAALLQFACCPPELRCAGGETGGAEDDTGRAPFVLPAAPYQILAPLDVDESALLVGRDFDIPHVAGLLDDIDTRLLLVHGAAGAGKTSLLRAGVVPYLEDDCIGYRLMRDRSGETRGEMATEFDFPIPTVRSGSDLAAQLALALVSFCARPLTYVTPAGTSVTVDLPALLAEAVDSPATELPAPESVRDLLRQDPDRLAEVLDTLTEQLPFELVLLVEQADDLFSLVKPGASGNDLQRTLAMLHATLSGDARAKLVLELRTEYLGRFLDALVQTPEDNSRVAAFLTHSLSPEQLIEVVLQPTSAEPLPNSDEVPLATYGFQFEEGVAENLVAEAVKFGGQNQESVLVLIHVLCGRLWQRVRGRSDKVIRALDVKAIGGVEKGLNKYVESVLQSARTRRDRKALTNLFLGLFIRQPDGSLTRDLMFEGEARSKWQSATPVEQVTAAAAADGVRLLDVAWMSMGGQEGNYLTLGHDALAPVAAQQAEEATRRAYGWTKMGDALWITVPLLILVAVFAGTRLYNMGRAIEIFKEEQQDFDKEIKQVKVERGQLLEMKSTMAWPAYVGQLRAAEQAYLAGDLVQMRKALLSSKPSPRKVINRPDEIDALDDRGFEWYYLWGLMHSHQAALLGHGATVTAVAIGPDGLTAATGGADGTVRLWDLVQRAELVNFDLKIGKEAVAVTSLAFSPDGTMLAAAADNKVVRLWQLNRLGVDYLPSLTMTLASLPLQEAGPLPALTSLAARALTGNSVKERASLTDHSAAVLSVAFSPDGKTLAAARQDHVVKLWDVSSDKPAVKHTLKEHTGPALTVAWSPDGKWLATGGADKQVHLWDPKAGKKEKTLPQQPGEVAALAWSADSKTLACGSAQSQGSYDSGVVALYDATSWKEQPLPQLHVAPVSALAFAANGKKLVIAGKDNAIRVVDATNGQELQALKGHLGWVSSLAQGRGGAVLLSGSFDGTAKVWEPELLASRDVLRVASVPVAAVLFAPNDRWLATGSGDGAVKLWDTATATEFKSFAGHKNAVLALAWAMDGKTLVSGDAQGTLKLWDADPTSPGFGKELDSVKAHAKELTCLGSTDRGKMLASGSADGTVKVWSFEDNKFTKKPVEIKCEGGAVWSLAVMVREDGPLLATGSEDGKVRMWNPASGAAAELKAPVLAGHTGRVTTLIFYANPKFLVTGSTDTTVRVWGLDDGKELMLRRCHAGAVTGLAVSLEGTIVSCSADHSVKVWDPNVGHQEERIALVGHAGPIRALALSGDRRLIAAAGQDGTVRLWRAAAPDVVRMPLRQ